jgi:phage portal protein BeeE
VARMFNIAPHKIKALQQSTNNIEQQTLDHASDTIQPFITNIEQEYAKKLFTSTDLNNGYYIRGI